MTRKIEQWSDESFPDPPKLLKLFRKLPDREVVITLCSIIDTLLADLISLRLINDKKELEEFIGLDGDGRAPLGSFGARIQAAYLLGLIEKVQLKNLRSLKDIRNLFSHNVLVTFDDERVTKKVKTIVTNLQATEVFRGAKIKKGQIQRLKRVVDAKGFSRDACRGYFVGEASIQIELLQHDILSQKEYITEIESKL